MGWTAEDKLKYQEGTQMFAEQMAMQFEHLTNAGFNPDQAVALMVPTILSQNRHEHYYYFEGDDEDGRTGEE